ncbi:MAG: hypothetical protein KIT84_29895 [Labilithrix sp.]|nr:hypothetical protein [Labilithrix sp.]MCW5815277.1 hypothetical protein [Labilithrix sp.]
MWALPLLLMTRPFRGYRALAEEPAQASLPLGAGRFLLVMGAMVSVSATGRFAPAELVLAMVSFAWLPLVHAISLALVVRVFARAAPWRRALAFYLEGVGPWLLLFLFFTGTVLFAPHPERPAFLFFGPMLLGAAIWSMVLSYAMFRAGLGLARRAAAFANVTFWVTNHVLILGYFLAVGQLWPIL